MKWDRKPSWQAAGNDCFVIDGACLEYLLDFSLRLGEKMILCGANIERVSDTIYRICDSYHCRGIHFFSLDCYLTLSLESEDGKMVSAQRCIRGGASIHLERLCRLNQLSRDICAKPPVPQSLGKKLEEAADAKSYSPAATLFFSLLSSAALTGIYDGTLPDLLIILLNMFLVNLAGGYLRKLVNNKIIYNVLSAFIIGMVALFFDQIGFLDGYSTVMIVNSLKLVPGVPMVNSFRNLLTGNESNGILELLKLLLETAGIACGFLLSIMLGLGRLA